MKKLTRYVVVDRRYTQDDYLKGVAVTGEIGAPSKIYEVRDAAVRDKFSTEKILEITLYVKEVKL